MNKGISEDIRLIIEVKVRLREEVPESLLIRYMSGLGNDTYAKKNRELKNQNVLPMTKITRNFFFFTVFLTLLNLSYKFSFLC